METEARPETPEEVWEREKMRGMNGELVLNDNQGKLLGIKKPKCC
jgi:hypothetical protein